MSGFDFSQFEAPPDLADLLKAPAERTASDSGLILPRPRDEIVEPSIVPVNVDEIKTTPRIESNESLLSLKDFEELRPKYYRSDERDAMFPFEPAFPAIQDLAALHYYMYPDIGLYIWQVEELLRISGYVNGRLDGERIHYNPHQAFRGSYATVNGSGKDMILIATTAVGLPLFYKHMLVVISTASHEQLKFQTAVHIKNGIRALHERVGFDVYDSVEFYHSCKERDGEIKLFVTDEEGRVEGWHPHHPKGRLALIINEAKTIPRPVFSAFDRCSGYSHWLEVSSPGLPAGLFYENHMSAVQYPARPERGRFFARKVRQAECPHKSEEDRLEMLRKHGPNSYIYRTSVGCEFAAKEDEVAVPLELVVPCRGLKFVADDKDIGIGFDIAGGGDECSVWVRRGAHPFAKKFFINKDTLESVDIVDAFLRNMGITPKSDYVFNYDDNGIGKGPGDYLVRKGWRVIRRHNQSAAIEKTVYLNIGAEIYGHLKRCYSHKLIPAPPDADTERQMTTRKTSDRGLGKIALQSKKEARADGITSPDRSDAWGLCYFSYRPDFREPPTEVAQKRLMTVDEFLEAANSNPHFVENLVSRLNGQKPTHGEPFTFQTGDI